MSSVACSVDHFSEGRKDRAKFFPAKKLLISLLFHLDLTPSQPLHCCHVALIMTYIELSEISQNEFELLQKLFLYTY